MGPGSSTAMNNPLPTTVPHLKPTGANWAIFSMCFQEAMEANQKWSHFKGMLKYPTPVDDKNIMANEQKAIDAWNLEDCYMLSQQLPDSTAICLKTLATVQECWKKVSDKFSIKSQYAETDLLTAFNDMCCPKGRNICKFLGQMRVKWEELAAVRVMMTEKEYHSAIIKSLPEDMVKFASSMLSTTHMLNPSKDIDANLLISVAAACLAALSRSL